MSAFDPMRLSVERLTAPNGKSRRVSRHWEVFVSSACTAEHFGGGLDAAVLT
jgi:hypothetical protein